MNKRVLILSTSAGSGHKTAAAALEKVFRQSPHVAEVVNKDALELTNEAHRNLYSKVFLDLVKKYPWFLGWWYDESDEPWKTDDMRHMLDRLSADPLVKFIKQYNPDIAVCTHYMPAGIISHLLSKGQLHTILSIVTTDYDFHSMWLSQLFHRYFVALDETREYLVRLGLPESHITVSGIPVDPAFAAPVDQAAVLAHYSLRSDRPILLLSGGTFGSAAVELLVKQLMCSRHDIQTVVVCGNNHELRRTVEELVVSQAARFRVLGYTSDMPGLMKVATLFIGKPGGLTASECMAAGLPMVIGMPIPGQEERNSDHLLEKGTAIKCNDLTIAAYKIDKLLDDPARLQQMRDNTRRLARPDAARTIVDTLLHTPEPELLQIGPKDKQRMASAVRGDAWIVPQRQKYGSSNVVLFNAHTGVPVGMITEAQLGFLRDHLEGSSAEDDNYYIHQTTVDLLKSRGGGDGLVHTLEKALAGHEDVDIRWARM